MPTLEQLLFFVEQANIKPLQSQDQLKDLWDLSEQLAERADEIEFSDFAPDRDGDDDTENKENIEAFLQNALLIIDNMTELQPQMLSILARLSIIDYKDFGYCCFCTLRDLLKSSSDLKPKVSDVILNEIINKLRQEDPTEIPHLLLDGLCRLIEDIGTPHMLTGMYDLCFPIWLRTFTEQLREQDQGKSKFGDHKHFDAIIKLIAVSVRNNMENAALLLDKHLAGHIVKIAICSDKEHRRYIPVLNIVADMANVEDHAADFFMAGGSCSHSAAAEGAGGQHAHGRKPSKHSAADASVSRERPPALYEELIRRIQQKLKEDKERKDKERNKGQQAKLAGDRPVTGQSPA